MSLVALPNWLLCFAKRLCKWATVSVFAREERAKFSNLHLCTKWATVSVFSYKREGKGSGAERVRSKRSKWRKFCIISAPFSMRVQLDTAHFPNEIQS